MSRMPHGTIRENHSMSGSTFSARPCIERPLVTLIPTAQILRGDGPSGSTHTPGKASRRPSRLRSSPRSPSASMTTCSTWCTKHGIAPASHLDCENRVNDELSRPVVGDVAASVRPHDVRTERFELGRSCEHVRRVPAQTERDHVRVLEHEQVVVGALIAESPAAGRVLRRKGPGPAT